MAAVTADLVIRNGTLVSHDGAIAGSIAIHDGRVLAVGADEAMPPARETFDASGLHILPGAIDVHVHFRDPGYPAQRRLGDRDRCGRIRRRHHRVRHAEHRSADRHCRGTRRQACHRREQGLRRFRPLRPAWRRHYRATSRRSIEGGVIGFKLYMGNTFGKIPSPSTGAMLEAFEVVAPTGKRISLHAETNSIMERRQDRLTRAGRRDPLAHIDSRPAIVAVEAVGRAALLAEWTGARIHILHISSAEELRPLREGKARGVDITGETCPHYLLLSTDDYHDLAGIIRVNPPVREARNHEPLWAALADGTIDLIATDHAPHTPEEKTRNDIWAVDCGFPGVETQMPLMLTRCNNGRLSLCDYVRLSSFNPAKIWGLYPRKGAIVPGADADLALVDLAREHTIADSELQSRSKISPWNGRRVKGLPLHTLVRGRFVMKDRALTEAPRGWGRSVHKIQQMPAAGATSHRSDHGSDRRTGATVTIWSTESMTAPSRRPPPF